MTKESILYTEITISKFDVCKNIPSKCMMQNQTALQRYMDKLITRLIDFNIPFSVNDKTIRYQKKMSTQAEALNHTFNA